MRLLINTLTALRRRTGVGHYVHELLSCLHSYPGVEIVQFPAPAVRRWLTRGTQSATRGPAGALRPWFNRIGRTLTAWHFHLFARRQAFDLYHEPNFLPLPCDRPTIATLLDLSVILHPEWHPADRVRHFERNLDTTLARCRHFLTISDFCKDELVAHLGIAPQRITRTYMGVRGAFRPLPPAELHATRQRLQLPEDYLLHVGTLEPRKNVLMLLRAYCNLPEGVRSRCPLVLVGGWGWKTKELAEYYEAEARHRGVRHLGYVADDDMPAVYGAARALLFPSFYEGFGLPPLEMLACGGAVLASTAGAHREIVGGQAQLIDAYDQDGWRQEMLRVMTDADWRRALQRGGVEWASRFTWEACAEATLAAYEAAVAGQPLRMSRAS